MKRSRIALLFLLLLTLAGVAWFFRGYLVPQRTAVIQSQEFVLYSLEPPNDNYDKPDRINYLKDKEIISAAVVLGKTKITDSHTKAELIDALNQGIAESKGFSAACFQPRHAFRATYGQREILAVICFECMNLTINGKGYITTDSPQTVFDRVLLEQGIPLGKR